MSSTCFETEGSSSGRRLYIQVKYRVFYTHQYKQSCRYKSVFYKTAYIDACKTHYTKPVYTTVFLKMNFRFRDMQKTSSN